MISPDWVIDPARVLVKRLMVIKGKHLGLLVVLILLVLLAMRIEGVLLLLGVTRCLRSAVIIILLLLFVLLIKEGKIVRILPFALARISVVSLVVLSGGERGSRIILLVIVVQFQELLRLLSVRWRALFVADRFVALITNENTVARIRIIIIGIGTVVSRDFVVP